MGCWAIGVLLCLPVRGLSVRSEGYHIASHRVGEFEGPRWVRSKRSSGTGDHGPNTPKDHGYVRCIISGTVTHLDAPGFLSPVDPMISASSRQRGHSRRGDT